MKKYIISILMCIVPVLGTSAQNFIDSLIQVYDHASIEEKRIMDITMTKLENEWKRTQVKEICGIPFGEKKEVALEVLKRKFGKPHFVTEDGIWYQFITYGGINFESVLFYFQSDGKRTYMNSCSFFSRKETNIDKLIVDFNLLVEKLKKYDLSKSKINDYALSGAISPLWDGHFRSMKVEFMPAIILDINKNEENKYVIRLMYGQQQICPFNYVNEEF